MVGAGGANRRELVEEQERASRIGPDEEQ